MRLSDVEREALAELEGTRCFAPEHFAHLRTLCATVRRLAASGPVVEVTEAMAKRFAVAFAEVAQGNGMDYYAAVKTGLTAALERKDHE